MTGRLDALDSLLAQFELYEPELGRALRTSPHILMLSLGESHLSAWETSSLSYFSGPSNTAAFNFFVQALHIPDPLRAALLKPDTLARGGYYSWGWDYSERLEKVHLFGSTLELAYSNRKGRSRLLVTAPLLPEAQRAAVLEWLTRRETLHALALGKPLDRAALTDLGLAPDWEACQIKPTSKTKEALETGVMFLVRLLVLYPAFPLILRGLGGEAAIRQFVENELAQREQDVQSAMASLPALPAEFWAEAALPELPLPHQVAPEMGLGAHLPPPNFWPRPEENKLLADALTRIYKNVPRKLSKLTEPRRY